MKNDNKIENYSKSIYKHNGYTISTDKAKLDIPAIHRFLSESAYWAKERSLDTVIKSIDNSFCIGIFSTDGSQVGFARVITDFTTFGYICDFFIIETHRGKGLGKWLIEYIVTYPELKGLHHILLATLDAHELYHRYGGFTNLRSPDKFMVRVSTERRKALGL